MSDPSGDLERATVGRVTRRLMPLFCLMYLIAYIDRQNVSYAKLDMVQALGLSEAAYGLGASLFFIGYFLFEAPSNLILARVGARVWFARIMFSWGLVTLALGFTQNAAMFYVLRFLLGATEAGFFPGVLYVLTLWYPQAHRARMVGLFMIASALANAVGAAVGGLLLGLDGFLELAGWQWVFLVTGMPAVLLAPYVLWKLPNGPEQAGWLPQAEKSWLASVLATERGGEVDDHRGAWKAIFDPRVLMLAGLYIGMPLGAYGLSYWLPTIVKSFGVSNAVNGFINVIPWLFVAVALWFVPRHAARHGASAWHIAGPVLLGAVALSLSVIVPGAPLKFAMLCVAAPAIFAAQPVFWSLPPSFLSGPRAAAGIAAINAVGNLGGFIAQNLVPVVRDATGSDLAPMLALAAVLLVTSVLIFAAMARLKRVNQTA
ncbi:MULTISPECIES: MFS transporter [unclassified Caulobacter]|jgi:MFS family permease|uniref:MFS transporter n=1 Tax=unclassified Caulobacter TaxID=2648921 RepID=UPI0007867AD7|nr:MULTISPECIES: MFS transporter [unclassified Caulobacter]AZS22148.1 MFS transporter [Caulobacter sp. FWC26]